MDGLTGILNESMSRGIDFLCSNQLSCGEFPSYRTYSREGDGMWHPDSSIFATALVCYSLRFVTDSKVAAIRKKAKQFLLEEMQPAGLWQYWSSRTGVRHLPDLDDTCCAAAIVQEDRPTILLDNLTAILGNRNRDGLFYTWIKPNVEEENDTDSVVNANVLFYLKEFEGIRTVRDYLYGVISQDREESSYWFYLTPAALYYMVARAYENGAQCLKCCSDIIKTKIQHLWLGRRRLRDELEVAMALCSLLSFGERDLPMLKPAVDALLVRQKDDGSWSRIRFAVGPPPPGPNSVWFASEALTTAFCLEALVKFLRCYRFPEQTTGVKTAPAPL